MNFYWFLSVAVIVLGAVIIAGIYIQYLRDKAGLGKIDD